MEILKISASSIKIKGKNAAIVIDPDSKIDAQIIIATQPIESLSSSLVEGERLIISGPGEYEAGGIGITGKSFKDHVIYTIFESVKIIFVRSDCIEAVPDDEEYDCVIVKAVSAFKDEILAPINTKCIVLYGDLTLADLKSENQEKVSKVNLKKVAEIQGKTFLLT